MTIEELAKGLEEAGMENVSVTEVTEEDKEMLANLPGTRPAYERDSNWNKGMKNLYLVFSWQGHDGVSGERLPAFDGSDKVKLMSTRDGIFFDDAEGNVTGPEILEAAMRRAMKALYGDKGEIAHWEHVEEKKYYAGDVGYWLEEERFCPTFSFKLHWDDCVPEPFDEWSA